MKRITREKAYSYELVPKEPLLTVDLNEEFIVETEDANNGRIRTSEQLPIVEFLPELRTMKFNPLAGPIYVNGVEEGDVLVVDILEIVVDNQGHTLFVPGNRPLNDSLTWAECRGPYTHIIRHLPGPSGTTSDGIGVLKEGVSWKLHPHIGTIGVVPLRPIQSGADSMYGQGPFGGNLDCRDLCKGTRLYLPVFQKGGLLYVGDVHASQADSEFYGVADETRAEVTLRCGVIKKKKIPFPRLEKENSIVQLCCGRPLEDAITQAFFWLMEWLVSDYGMERREACLHMGVNPNVRINVYQMAPIGRLLYTVGVEFPKANLPK
jgi:acetamidase/formamidase